MKPSFLKRHLSGCHPDLATKDIDFFKHKEVGVKRIRLDHGGQFSQQTQAGVRASYMVAFRIAQAKKPHTIAENLILPCCKDIVHCVLGDSAEKKLASLPFSNDTIKRRIRDMADDVEQQIVAEILGAPLNTFSIQLDESTDVSSCAQLLVFARYIKDGDFKEEFLFCQCLETSTKGEDIFQQVSDYFEKMGLSWKNVSACTTDGAPAMLGIHSGFRARVKRVNPVSKHNHCMIHRYALASKTLPSHLKLVLDDIVTMVNFIKSSALNTRMFRLLCQEIDSDHENLLFYTEVRWLSRGNMLSRVSSLKNQLLEFFERDGKEKSKLFFNKLSDKEWLKKLVYLTDIFTRINLLNKSLQGRFTIIIDFVDRIRAFLMKLELWEAKVSVGKLDFFENLSAALGDTTDQSICALIKAHLSALRNGLQDYFPDLSDSDMKMIRNPFILDVTSIPDILQEEFVELINDSNARQVLVRNERDVSQRGKNSCKTLINVSQHLSL